MQNLTDFLQIFQKKLQFFRILYRKLRKFYRIFTFFIFFSQNLTFAAVRGQTHFTFSPNSLPLIYYIKTLGTPLP